jgi:hypothetical protein
MTDENATQAGSPGAVMNEVAAVTRRLIDGLLGSGTIVPQPIAKAFEVERHWRRRVAVKAGRSRAVK